MDWSNLAFGDRWDVFNGCEREQRQHSDNTPLSNSTKLFEKKSSAANHEEPLTLETVSKFCSTRITFRVSILVWSLSPLCLLIDSLWLRWLRWLTLAIPATSPASDAKARMPPPCNANVTAPVGRRRANRANLTSKAIRIKIQTMHTSFGDASCKHGCNALLWLCGLSECCSK